MRYIFETHDEEGLIGIQIAKWKKEGKLELIEKGEPIVQIKAQLERVARALEILKQAGYNSQVMKSWLHEQTKISKRDIDKVLDSQEEFFKQIGVIPPKK